MQKLNEAADQHRHSVDRAGRPRIQVRGIAINEDNNGEEVFVELQSGGVKVCYASPETLLRNEKFKRLFRTDSFRASVISLVVDEAHVIQVWAVDSGFRKDYAELETLKTIAGTEIPWTAVSATMPTRIFETVFTSLRMGVDRPFWGMDLGSDRHNILYIVRAMEYAMHTFADLFFMVPDMPSSRNDLPKSIFYLSERTQVKAACDMLRTLLPVSLRKLLMPFYASHSEGYKKTVMERFKSGEIRWLFATSAAGMGFDIPDIIFSVLYGIRDITQAAQEGGRAVREARLQGQMIWLVPRWAFDPPVEMSAVSKELDSKKKPVTAQEKKDNAQRDALDSGTRLFINRSQSDRCMRAFLREHFRPEPTLPGFPRSGEHQSIGGHNVSWEVRDERSQPTPGRCCSARCCRIDPGEAIGVLTMADHARVHQHLQTLLSRGIAPTAPPDTPSTSAGTPEGTPKSPANVQARKRYRCPQEERQLFRDVLTSWRDSRWAEIKLDNPFLTPQWVLPDECIDGLVAQAHQVVNATDFDLSTVRRLAESPFSDDDSMQSLARLLERFQDMFLQRRQAGHQQGKRAKTTAMVNKQVEPESPTRKRTSKRSLVPANWTSSRTSKLCVFPFTSMSSLVH